MKLTVSILVSLLEKRPHDLRVDSISLCYLLWAMKPTVTIIVNIISSPNVHLVTVEFNSRCFKWHTSSDWPELACPK